MRLLRQRSLTFPPHSIRSLRESYCYWVKADEKPALNVDLWQQLLPLLERHEVEFVWVKGHAGHPENERCDRMAVEQRDFYSA